MKDTVQISGTMHIDVRNAIDELARKEVRSFSQMLEIVSKKGLEAMGLEVKPKEK